MYFRGTIGFGGMRGKSRNRLGGQDMSRTRISGEVLACGGRVGSGGQS